MKYAITYHSTFKSLLLTVCLLNFAGFLQAQWYMDLGTSQEYNNNPFRTPEENPGWINTVNASLERDLNKISLGYSGAYSQFTSESARNYFWHQIALWQVRDVANWGITAEQRINQPYYSYYDYFQGELYYNHRFGKKQVKWTFAGQAMVDTYQELSEYNNLKFIVGLRARRTFEQSRTTIIGHVGGSWKNYLTQETVTTTNTSGGFMGRHSGGRRMTSASLSQQRPGIGQLRGSLRVGQSLSATTGLALQYRHQFVLKSSDRYFSDITYVGLENSDIFDDPIQYSGGVVNAELTQLLPLGVTLKISYSGLKKNYSVQGIYTDAETYDASVQRKDDMSVGWIHLWKILPVSVVRGSTMQLNVQYRWIDNRSNSYWYDYSTQSVSVGIEFQI